MRLLRKGHLRIVLYIKQLRTTQPSFAAIVSPPYPRHDRYSYPGRPLPPDPPGIAWAGTLESQEFDV